jgi:thioredoxin-related protein
MRISLAALCFFVSLVCGAADTGDLPLHTAAARGDVPALGRAIRSGADIERGNAAGKTPLMVAIQSEQVEAIAALLEAGASPDHADRLGGSPLHLAAAGPAEVAELLTQAGADVNARNAGGVTALMLAAAAGQSDVVELLRSSGARLDFRDYQGSSAADWAERGGQSALAQTLRGKTADLETGSSNTASQYDFDEDVFVDVEFPDWFKQSFLDLRDDLDEAISAGKQGLLLFFSTRRCSYCKAFIQKSLEDPEIRRRVETGFDVIGLEIFDDTEISDLDGRTYRVRDLVTEMRAAYTPTLIFYGEGGRRLLRIVGYYPPDKFRIVLDYLEGRHYLKEHFRNYLARTQPAPAGRSGGIIRDGALFAEPPHILDRRAAASDRPLLVVFERPDCDACERFHRRVLGDRAIRRLIGEFEAVQLDVSDSRARIITPSGQRLSPGAWFETLNLSYCPAIVFFDERGREVMRLDSETLRFRMEGSLQLVLEAGYVQDAQLQRWRRTKAIEAAQ